MKVNFEDISYLKAGNDKQQKAYNTLKKYRLLDLLEMFDPILTGTIPINIDIEASDLDISCCYSDKNEFIRTVTRLFANEKHFTLRESSEFNSVVCSFGWTISRSNYSGKTSPPGSSMLPGTC